VSFSYALKQKTACEIFNTQLKEEYLYYRNWQSFSEQCPICHGGCWGTSVSTLLSCDVRGVVEK